MIRFKANKILQTAEGSMPLDISFELERGKLLSIYGNSGAGKTTILRILAGLTTADNVLTEVDNEIWDDSKNNIHLAIKKRSIGFLFQDYALFPNLTVKENLEYALTKGEDKKLVNELLELMELQQLQNSKPQNLS